MRRVLVKPVERAEVSEPLKSVGAITLFVEDPQRSKSFYENVFDVSAIYEDENAAAFRFGNMIVNLLEIPAARDLIDPGAVAGREAGSRFQLTIWVDDADAVCSDLATRGGGAERPDEPGLGNAHCQLHRSRRPHLGDRSGAPRGQGLVGHTQAGGDGSIRNAPFAYAQRIG